MNDFNKSIPIIPRSGNYLEDSYDDFLEQEKEESEWEENDNGT